MLRSGEKRSKNGDLRECNHPTCGSTCRKKKEPKRRAFPKKRPVAIRKVSKKRKAQIEIYSQRSRPMWEGKLCAIRSPVCTIWAQGMNHVEGRIGERLIEMEKTEPSCNACNTWVEDNPDSEIGQAHKIVNYEVRRKILYKKNP